ncbi:hypothetical protein CANCADRAFT_72563 [Tortispora caseinolytica NRRL Y-17796]|uniref:Cytochrome b5 heme-binding domain-containing protein n=1 Tax=Tortispora caseinolytica NRRL Y-17796 TaxID=767744 RepID=A0A1E4TIN2_9ASCO|nr:hypothetical protein CANCADRAFT_72563 [Tortispora caseinolytica NRRL Y-17796]
MPSLILLLIGGLVLYILLRNLFSDSRIKAVPARNSDVQKSTIVFEDYTPQTLVKFNGKDHPKILIAVNRKVYDVSKGANFYGPGAPYHNFAGRDASRGLAYNSFDSEVLTDIDKPIDPLDDLSPAERDSLDQWESRLAAKYTLCGRLVEHEP